MPELWNNLPAAVMRSRMPYATVPTRRGRRYFGQPRMNMTALVVHGLSAMSVYSDVIFVRVLIAAALVACASIVAIVGVTLVRLLTDLAVPGWATTAVGDLLIILLLTAVIVVATCSWCCRAAARRRSCRCGTPGLSRRRDASAARSAVAP